MNELSKRLITALVLSCALSILFWISSPPFFVGLMVCCLGYILLYEWPRFKLGWLTPWYPVLPFLALINLYLSNRWLWAYLVCVIAAYDTGAYLVGRYCGSIRLAPRISSKKTVEGLMGGIVSAAIMSIFIAVLLQKDLYYGILYRMLQGIFIAVLAFCGDLLESWFKRRAGIKDAGSLLPGHGGVLDRIDGLLVGALIYDIFY